MKYNPQELETKWQSYWDREGLFRVSENPDQEKYYLLEMFPYPSGRILVEDETFLFGYDHDGAYSYNPRTISTLKNKLFAVHKDSTRGPGSVSRIPKKSRTMIQKNWSCDIPVKAWAMRGKT